MLEADRRVRRVLGLSIAVGLATAIAFATIPLALADPIPAETCSSVNDSATAAYTSISGTFTGYGDYICAVGNDGYVDFSGSGSINSASGGTVQVFLPSGDSVAYASLSITSGQCTQTQSTSGSEVQWFLQPTDNVFPYYCDFSVTVGGATNWVIPSCSVTVALEAVDSATGSSSYVPQTVNMC